MANGNAAPLKLRKDVWKLPEGDTTLEWYARAVADMQSRPAEDPTSWQFQGAVHGTQLPPENFTPVQAKTWSQCQHATWFFLPWHRAYLAMFEQIVGATVQKLGGPADWALPYWNYSAPPDAATGFNPRRLPAAFVADKTSFADANPLRVAARDQGNDGAVFLDDRAVSLDCLLTPAFGSDPVGGDSGFGGPARGPNHMGDANQGQLEVVPHDQIHVEIGGLMGDPDTAALDPIFWLHHANIDRLWEVWLRRDPNNQNPADAQWRDAVRFTFFNADHAQVSYSASEVLDTTRSPCLYQYDDVSDPLAQG